MLYLELDEIIILVLGLQALNLPCYRILVGHTVIKFYEGRRSIDDVGKTSSKIVGKQSQQARAAIDDMPTSLTLTVTIQPLDAVLRGVSAPVTDFTMDQRIDALSTTASRV